MDPRQCTATPCLCLLTMTSRRINQRALVQVKPRRHNELTSEGLIGVVAKKKHRPQAPDGSHFVLLQNSTSTTADDFFSVSSALLTAGFLKTLNASVCHWPIWELSLANKVQQMNCNLPFRHNNINQLCHQTLPKRAFWWV